MSRGDAREFYQSTQFNCSYTLCDFCSKAATLRRPSHIAKAFSQSPPRRLNLTKHARSYGESIEQESQTGLISAEPRDPYEPTLESL